MAPSVAVTEEAGILTAGSWRLFFCGSGLASVAGLGEEAWVPEAPSSWLLFCRRNRSMLTPLSLVSEGVSVFLVSSSSPPLTAWTSG